MKYAPIDPRLFAENRQRLAAALKPGSIAIVHSADVPARSADGVMRFIQDSNLFYLTGADQEETVLVLCPGAEDEALREILFVRETSDFIAIWEGQKLDKEEAARVSGIQNVQWLDAFEPMMRRLMRKADRVYLDYNEHPRSGAGNESRTDRFRKRWQSLYPDHRYERLAPLLYRQRVVKSDIEIAVIRHACEITEAGFRRVLGLLKPGVREYEVEAEFAHEFMRRGSRGFAYEPIVASGANNCVLHYLANDQVCRDGDLLLIDAGAEYANYNADMTRTLPVNGKFTPRQRAVYDAVHRVLRACIDDLIHPGLEIKAYQKQVGAMVEAELIQLGLLNPDAVAEEKIQGGLAEETKLYRKYFMHGTSHSLGLDVHDVTPVDAKFQENMVVTVEPGIYLREEGFGIRLENNIVIRKSGNIDLMATIPIDADEIETLMGGGS